jgi:hypothetical protein
MFIMAFNTFQRNNPATTGGKSSPSICGRNQTQTHIIPHTSCKRHKKSTTFHANKLHFWL